LPPALSGKRPKTNETHLYRSKKEISLFKLLGILSALVGGIVEEVFFRRWIMDMLMSRGVAPIIQVIISGIVFG
jgi:membrane protease YdiL (CAAX protease family)